MDALFTATVLAQTSEPQKIIYAAMHQDYSDRMVSLRDVPDEETCGNILVKRLLAGGRGHYGPLEHPQITFTCGYFPHSVIQQARTHRVGITFDVQSMRYTSQSIIRAAEGNVDDLEKAFYIRPVGDYSDRNGTKYFFSEMQRHEALAACKYAAIAYRKNILEHGMSEEHGRSLLPFDYRQHFVVSFNARSFLHFMDLRSKKDAQLEIQQLCDLLWVGFVQWCPAIATWYSQHRLGKSRLAP